MSASQVLSVCGHLYANPYSPSADMARFDDLHPEILQMITTIAFEDNKALLLLGRRNYRFHEKNNLLFHPGR